MPIYEYWCEDCNRLWEDLVLKISDGKESIECPVCKKELPRAISTSNIRMGKVFTAGGPCIEDKDGHESLGMTGEQMEESAREQSDLKQYVREGGDPMDFAIKRSPQYEREE